MANKNSKQNRKLAHKLYRQKQGRDFTFTIPKTIAGQTALSSRTQIITIGGSARISKKPKVAAGRKNDFGNEDN